MVPDKKKSCSCYIYCTPYILYPKIGLLSKVNISTFQINKAYISKHKIDTKVCVCVRTCVRVCVRACVCVHAVADIAIGGSVFMQYKPLQGSIIDMCQVAGLSEQPDLLQSDVYIVEENKVHCTLLFTVYLTYHNKKYFKLSIAHCYTLMFNRRVRRFPLEKFSADVGHSSPVLSFSLQQHASNALYRIICLEV